jgi:hypothetical protein
MEIVGKAGIITGNSRDSARVKKAAMVSILGWLGQSKPNRLGARAGNLGAC